MDNFFSVLSGYFVLNYFILCPYLRGCEKSFWLFKLFVDIFDWEIIFGLHDNLYNWLSKNIHVLFIKAFPRWNFRIFILFCAKIPWKISCLAQVTHISPMIKLCHSSSFPASIFMVQRLNKPSLIIIASKFFCTIFFKYGIFRRMWDGMFLWHL